MEHFTLRLLGFGERGFSNVVFLADPAAIKTVFTAGSDTLRVGELRAPMAPMFGSGSILLLDGAWGVMINEGFIVFSTSPWPVLLPSLCISIVLLAFTFVGDGLRDALDPRSKM